MANSLTLAVAGSGKTQKIVNYCKSISPDRRLLIVTLTQANQGELRSRLSRSAGDHSGILVVGWYTFLIRDFARPFFPFKFPGEKIQGFSFEGRPSIYASGLSRFVNNERWAYASELGRLANELIEDSNGALIRRLECIYDEIWIDEVQDLSAHDWEIIHALLQSKIEIKMVGDVRQAILSTNPRSKKNRKYAYSEAIRWFRERETEGLLNITEMSTTWRCNPEISLFADTIFDDKWSFPKMKSNNLKRTEHDGVFLIRRECLPEYVTRFSPQCLRNSRGSEKSLELNFLNFGESKGLEFERILIIPTEGICKFIQSGTFLEPFAAAKFYVAITRAVQSVAILIDKPGKSLLPYWRPG